MSQRLFFFTLSFLLLLANFSQAQSTDSNYLVRSTIGVSGSSESITVRNKPYFVQQSLGQASVIGTSKNSGYTLRQGFIQPNVLAKILDPKIPLDLGVNLYPNPFTKNISLVFSQEISGNIEVAVFDMLGKLILSKTYVATQNLQIKLDKLSLGSYVLKVIANNRQFIENIIKGSFD